jgi:hypothetical protein
MKYADSLDLIVNFPFDLGTSCGSMWEGKKGMHLSPLVFSREAGNSNETKAFPVRGFMVKYKL